MKLSALARDHGADELRPVPGEFGIGAAVLAGDEAWILLDEDPAVGLGAAVAWAIRRSASSLRLVAETGTATLARRATAFAFPVEVAHVEGRTLLAAIAERLAPGGPVPPEHDALRSLIVAGGAEPIVEHGVLTGEVAGLEVCRVVTDAESGVARLEVGVGAHDREAFQLLHGDVPAVEALAGVVAVVADARRPGAPAHPLNRLARSRAVRALLIREPQRIGATVVEPVEPPVARTNVRDDVPCAAIATIDGEEIAVVCSAGVDLDAVPFATDARLDSGAVDCVVVLAAGCDLPIQYELAAALRRPMRIATVDIA